MEFQLPFSPRADLMKPAPFRRGGEGGVPRLFTPGAFSVQGEGAKSERKWEEEGVRGGGVGGGGGTGAKSERLERKREEGDGGEAERWFFNSKVQCPPDHHYSPDRHHHHVHHPPQHQHQQHHQQPQERTRQPLIPVRPQAYDNNNNNNNNDNNTNATFPRARGEAGVAPPRNFRQSRGGQRVTLQSRGGLLAAKPLFTGPDINRHRKLKAIPPVPSPQELREKIDCQTAESIGDSLIFHNIPDHCEDTPEAEVVQFCTDYLVGRRIRHVHFGQVHRMQQRFSKDAPIAARFALSLQHGPAGGTDRTQAHQPLPFIPPVRSRKLPSVLQSKNRRRLQYHIDV